MARQETAYLVIFKTWTPDLCNTQDTCVIVGKEVFMDLSDAMSAGTDDIVSRGYTLPTPTSWSIDAEKNNFIQIGFEDKTHTGESCKRIARWEIHPLYIRPITH